MQISNPSLPPVQVHVAKFLAPCLIMDILNSAHTKPHLTSCIVSNSFQTIILQYVQDGLIRTPNLKGLQFIIENSEKAISEQFTEYYVTAHAFHACTENFY